MIVATMIAQATIAQRTKRPIFGQSVGQNDRGGGIPRWTAWRFLYHLSPVRSPVYKATHGYLSRRRGRVHWGQPEREHGAHGANESVDGAGAAGGRGAGEEQPQEDPIKQAAAMPAGPPPITTRSLPLILFMTSSTLRALGSIPHSINARGATRLASRPSHEHFLNSAVRPSLCSAYYAVQAGSGSMFWRMLRL